MIANDVFVVRITGRFHTQFCRRKPLTSYIPNDLKEVTPEQRETLDKMIERLEEFDDVQTVYTNMQPEEGEEE